MSCCASGENKLLLEQKASRLLFLRRSAGGRLGLLLQDGLTPEVVGQSAVPRPHCQFAVDAHFNHLLLPRDGNASRGEVAKKLCVLVLQLHALHRGEGPHVVDVLGVNCLRVGHKGGWKDSWGEATEREKRDENYLSYIYPSMAQCSSWTREGVKACLSRLRVKVASYHSSTRPHTQTNYQSTFTPVDNFKLVSSLSSLDWEESKLAGVHFST